MTKLYLLSFFLVLGLTTNAQTYTRQSSPQQIVSKRLISLNGGMRSAAGGKSRTVIPINLPQGTTSWYYSFSTNPAGSGTKNLQLLMQLTAAASDPTQLSSMALSNFQIPSGSHTIDVYLLDHKNVEGFNQKWDNNGGGFYYNREGSVTATREATVRVNQTIGPIYLGLKNPSSLDGVDITIEVVAIVSSKVYEDTWTTTSTDLIYNGCLNSFATNELAIEQICNCYKSKVTADYSPSRYSQLSQSSKDRLLKSEIANCASETKNQSAIDKDKRAKELSEILQGQGVTKDYEGQEETFRELLTLGFNSWEIYNGLGFCQLCLKKFEYAKKNLQIGLGKNSTSMFLLGNLANYYLLTENYSQAIDIYKEYKNKRLENKGRFKDAVSDDLKEFERLGLSNPGFAIVREELNIK